MSPAWIECVLVLDFSQEQLSARSSAVQGNPNLRNLHIDGAHLSSNLGPITHENVN